VRPVSSVPFHYVDLRAFCYATEDDKRVEQALRTYLPEEAEVRRAVSEGHHGDRIVVLSARLENADDVRHVLGKLRAIDTDDLLAELDDRIDDDCAFYLTLDKQQAFNGSVARGDGITLRSKVEAYPAKREHALQNAREALQAL